MKVQKIKSPAFCETRLTRTIEQSGGDEEGYGIERGLKYFIAATFIHSFVHSPIPATAKVAHAA